MDGSLLQADIFSEGSYHTNGPLQKKNAPNVGDVKLLASSGDIHFMVMAILRLSTATPEKKRMKSCLLDTCRFRHQLLEYILLERIAPWTNVPWRGTTKWPL